MPKNAKVNEITACLTSQDSVYNIFDNNLANRWLATSISQTKVPNCVVANCATNRANEAVGAA